MTYQQSRMFSLSAEISFLFFQVRFLPPRYGEGSHLAKIFILRDQLYNKNRVLLMEKIVDTLTSYHKT